MTNAQMVDSPPRNLPDAGTRPPKRRRWLRLFLQALIVLAFLGWLALAVRFQLTGSLRVVVLVGIGVALLALTRLWWAGRSRAVWGGTLALMAVAAVWWSSIRPAETADWQVPVQYGVTAEVDGNDVTLHNVRNFDWTSQDAFTPKWETRRYKLDQLTGVDLFSSVWGNPNIAHIMIGFGFADGQHVVFSVETRMRQGQVYAPLAGFFRSYNLVLVAADERDIIRLRTDLRVDPPEVVSLFAVPAVGVQERRQAFVDFLNLGNRLEHQAEFYNTLTTNCTTVPWQLARSVGASIPLSWKVLASGRFPEYLHELGLLAPDMPLDQILAKARLSALGPAGADGVAFSRRIRAMAGL